MTKYSKFFIPAIYIGVVIVMVMSVIMLLNGVKNYLTEEPDFNYSIDSVFEDGDVVPVNKTESDMIIRPYISDNVKVGKPFYDYKADSKEQELSLIQFHNTYIQNKGVDYVSDENFDVVSVLDGEIVSIEDNEIYGKVLTIKHSDNLKIVYSNITDVLVNNGYSVSQGELIAMSDKSKIDENSEYLLHFEVYYKDKQIDPESLYTLSVSELE